VSKEKRHLIDTADERTWKFDRPVIFLGEWCRFYNRQHLWEPMDAIVAEPYGLGLINKDADFSEARRLEGRLFPLLCRALNQHHNKNHDARFWQIVLGHWFRRYVEAMLNRVETLKQCLREHHISGFVAYDNKHYALATQDSYSSIWAFNDDRWNNALNAHILILLGLKSFAVETIKAPESVGFRLNFLVTTPTLKSTLLKWGSQQVSKCLSWFARDNDAFIINSYLSKQNEIKLQLALRQCPKLWVSPKYKAVVNSDKALRTSLARQFSSQSSSQSDNDLEAILTLMLFKLLPVCYLEGFYNLNKLVDQQPWPKHPKFIFTSNNFDTDEVFKLWAATKIEAGSKYFTGQHGNNYGTHRYINCTIEEITADKFLTWGWTDGLQQHTPAFLLKSAARKAKYCNPDGGLLLIELCLNHRITTWDGTAEFIDYFTNQQNFLNELAITPRQNLTIRLHADCRYLNWNEEARWKRFDSALKIDAGSVNICDLIANSRLVVHSYDSTGILETLSQNIPTLAFWQNGFDHLRESAKPFYNLLVDVGIVHFTPEAVAQKVNEVWDDIDTWWRTPEVQDARKKFCDRYAKQSENPVQDLKFLIN